MIEDPEAATETRPGPYEARLLSAGAAGLAPADIEELATALAFMDAKIRLLRGQAAETGGDYSSSPVTG